MFGDHMEIFMNYPVSYVALLSKDITDNADYNEVIKDSEIPLISLCCLFFAYYKTFVIALQIALISYLYRKAVSYEKQ